MLLFSRSLTYSHLLPYKERPVLRKDIDVFLLGVTLHLTIAQLTNLVKKVAGLHSSRDVAFNLVALLVSAELGSN